MAKKRSAGRTGSKPKAASRDLPVRSAGKVKGGTMADLGSSDQFALQQATQQATQGYATASNVLRKASDTQAAVIKNLKG
jgi:hypothetical protein